MNVRRVFWEVFGGTVFFAAFMLAMSVALGIPYLLFQVNDIVGAISAFVIIPLSLASLVAFGRFWLDYLDKKDAQYRRNTIRIEAVSLPNVKDSEALIAALGDIERRNGRASYA